MGSDKEHLTCSTKLHLAPPAHLRAPSLSTAEQKEWSPHTTHLIGPGGKSASSTSVGSPRGDPASYHQMQLIKFLLQSLRTAANDMTHDNRHCHQLKFDLSPASEVAQT